MGARKYLVPLDLNGLELRNAVLHLLSSDPGSPTEGQLYYNTTSHAVEFYNGTTFVVLGKLDQISAPATDVSLGTHKITNLGTPSASTDAATKGYVDGLTTGITSWKQAVRAASTANGTLATAFAAGQVIDGVTLVLGDRILLKNQTSGAENGIRVVTAGTPTRTADSDAGSEILGTGVFVEEGTANAASAWILTTTGTITVDTTALTFVQFSGLGQVTAGDGLTKTGNTIQAVAGATPGTGGPGGGLVMDADDIVIDKAVVARHFAADVGDGSSTSIVLTHNLGTLDVLVQVYVKGTAGALVECDVQHTTTNTVTLVFAVAPASAAYRATIIG